MNSQELGTYYTQNYKEFEAENGHEKLLVGLKKFIQRIDTSKKILALDVGSCIGEYIPHLEELCPEHNKEILAFEPNPVNYSVIEQKIKQKPYIHLYKNCISNESSTSTLYNYINKNQNSSGNGIAGLRSGGDKICDVQVKRLDEIIMENYNIDDILIKFIKIDTEGNDTNVIKGLGFLIQKTNYILFECSDCLDDMRGPGIKNPMKDIVDYLSLNGFDTYRIGTKKMFKVNDEYWNDIYESFKFWSNCFAIRKDDPLIHTLIDNNFNYKF
jgi:FkbM family methyltransferase